MKLKLIIPLILLSILIGCVILNMEKGIIDREEGLDINSDSDGQEHEIAVKTDDNDKKDKQDNNYPEETKPIVENSVETKRLISEQLEKLDNTVRSWWLKLNDTHETPYVPEDIVNMLADFDGIYTGDASRKCVYLTFDEGYENGFTPKILDVLKENNVKSIFFITGPYLEKNTELVKRMLDEGHQVENHSVNHFSLPSIDDSTLKDELCNLDDRFNALFGLNFKYMRPPKGEYSERTLAAAQQLGYKTVFWSYAYKDWDVNDQKGADYAYTKVMNNLHNGAVILLHAVSKDNADALDRIIKGIREEGYTINPFDL